MEKEIAQLVHYFVRVRLSNTELVKLFVHVQNDPGLQDYIMMDTLIYKYGLQNKRPGRISIRCLSRLSRIVWMGMIWRIFGDFLESFSYSTIVYRVVVISIAQLNTSV
ncbi:MAG: hypothetical protein EA359_03525 [Balneolaceae bacterium]|nr:MAG: hypothetical protein EA359_03525 [Balneolaceae bacterium]